MELLCLCLSDLNDNIDNIKNISGSSTTICKTIETTWTHQTVAAAMSPTHLEVSAGQATTDLLWLPKVSLSGAGLRDDSP